jgi:hypothetical protein
MSMQLAKVLVPPSVAAPRGAQWASALAVGLTRLGRRVWRALEGVGQARAARELRALAERHAHQPELAQTLRDAMHRAAMHRDSQN